MKKIARISPNSAGKVGAILFIPISFLASAIFLLSLGILRPEFGSTTDVVFIVGIYAVQAFFFGAFVGAMIGLLMAWLYNRTLKYTGGILVEFADA